MSDCDSVHKKISPYIYHYGKQRDVIMEELNHGQNTEKRYHKRGYHHGNTIMRFQYRKVTHQKDIT